MFKCEVCLKNVDDKFESGEKENMCQFCAAMEGFQEVEIKSVEELMQTVWGINKEDKPNIEVDIIKNDLYGIYVNPYKSVATHFTSTKKSSLFQEMLQENSIHGIKELAHELDYKFKRINTYNHESALDSTLQIEILYTGDSWLHAEDTILFVSYHYNEDVRGNYSPYIAIEPHGTIADFMGSLSDLYCYTKTGYSWCSDTAGYDWSYTGNHQEINLEEGLEIEDNMVFWNNEELHFSSNLIK